MGPNFDRVSHWGQVFMFVLVLFWTWRSSDPPLCCGRWEFHQKSWKWWPSLWRCRRKLCSYHHTIKVEWLLLSVPQEIWALLHQWEMSLRGGPADALLPLRWGLRWSKMWESWLFLPKRRYRTNFGDLFDSSYGDFDHFGYWCLHLLSSSSKEKERRNGKSG